MSVDTIVGRHINLAVFGRALGLLNLELENEGHSTLAEKVVEIEQQFLALPIGRYWYYESERPSG